MPKFRVYIELYRKREVVDAPSENAAIQQILGVSPIVYDERYWNMEKHAFAMNGEDF
jgi:hypothetical protein